MDHYKVLGIERNASKEEIKKAFRGKAMQFHPDKHTHSPSHLRHAATAQFKRLSEAYDVLMDDAKRSQYNLGGPNHSSPRGNYYYDSGRRTRAGSGAGSVPFELLFRYFSTREFARHATFAGILIAGMYVVDAGGGALWKTINSGKSFEEALGSLEQAKERSKRR